MQYAVLMVCPPLHHNISYVVTTIIRLRNLIIHIYPSGCVGTLKERELPVFCSFTKKVIGQLVAAVEVASNAT